jgi:hypothetical protein
MESRGGLVAVIVLVAALSGKVEYEVLYTGLDEAEAATSCQARGHGRGREGAGLPARSSSRWIAPTRPEDAGSKAIERRAQLRPLRQLATLGANDLQMQTYLQYQLQENRGPPY